MKGTKTERFTFFILLKKIATKTMCWILNVIEILQYLVIGLIPYKILNTILSIIFFPLLLFLHYKVTRIQTGSNNEKNHEHSD